MILSFNKAQLYICFLKEVFAYITSLVYIKYICNTLWISNFIRNALNIIRTYLTWYKSIVNIHMTLEQRIRRNICSYISRSTTLSFNSLIKPYRRSVIDKISVLFIDWTERFHVETSQSWWIREIYDNNSSIESFTTESNMRCSISLCEGLIEVE